MASCAIGEVRNKKFKAVRVKHDGYPTKIGQRIQDNLKQNDPKSFLENLFIHSDYYDFDTPYQMTPHDFWTALFPLPVDYLYVWNFDDENFYICVRHPYTNMFHILWRVWIGEEQRIPMKHVEEVQQNKTIFFSFEPELDHV